MPQPLLSSCPPWRETSCTSLPISIARPTAACALDSLSAPGGLRIIPAVPSNFSECEPTDFKIRLNVAHYQWEAIGFGARRGIYSMHDMTIEQLLNFDWLQLR